MGVLQFKDVGGLRAVRIGGLGGFGFFQLRVEAEVKACRTSTFAVFGILRSGLKFQNFGVRHLLQ